MMAKFTKPILVFAALLFFTQARSQELSQGEAVPKGAIVYSLPSTSFRVTAKAVRESFVAGPYARFAQKYLGIQAREESGDFYTLSTVRLVSFVEADRSSNIALNLGNSRNASANFLEMMSQGLVMWSDSNAGKDNSARFPSVQSKSSFDKTQSTPNLTNVSTILYKTVQTASGLERVPVQQSQVVEKSLEKKAEEAAATIFRLRTKRMEIITGETDATFSGDALRAAIDEINRLEGEYLSLFTGKSSFDSQEISFDVVPVKENPRQIYVAFRISETQGLLGSDNMAGRPVVVELTGEEPALKPVNMDLTAEKGRVIYKTPAIMTARIMDGQTLLLQTRVPVYQFGQVMSFPLEVATGK